ncbi:unnamed protein product [Pocillopora meandrina]|uniref:Uncharacterized protein n=1 Tax=Pocillopora meandrina TaxID=46732 RepID=A0AAU9X0T9_9CNID|nr:unnamed protein product [Pocillopora meandrina]
MPHIYGKTSTHQPFLLASIDDPVDEASTEVVNIDVSHLNGSNESQDDDSAELLQEGDSDLNRNTAKLCSIFESFNMITPTSCTLLDLFVTTRRDLISESGLYPLEISHHNLVYVTMKLKNKRPPLNCIKMRDYKRLDQDKFQSDIESAPFHIGSIFDNADTRL